jgi:hypothetical protein
MGRFDTRFSPPPVNIGRAGARTAQSTLLLGASATSRGAGGWGAREARNASVPMQLRIDRGEGPTRENALPVGRTQRKRGYPPISLSAAKALTGQ